MAKDEKELVIENAPPVVVDKLTQLTAADVLNIVSKAAQDAARKATGNETRDAFIAFNRSLVEQLGGDTFQPIG